MVYMSYTDLPDRLLQQPVRVIREGGGETSHSDNLTNMDNLTNQKSFRGTEDGYGDVAVSSSKFRPDTSTVGVGETDMVRGGSGG
ncbi:hypothetical protein EON63_06845, partial [archaeon]